MKEKINLNSQTSDAPPSDEAGQIVHLKRLLVTLKQQYEKNLQTLNEQLETEIAQKKSLQGQHEKLQIAYEDNQKSHEDELLALREQQMVLRDLFKKTQEESSRQIQEKPQAAGSSNSSEKDLIASQQRTEQLEQAICYLKKKIEDSQQEGTQFKDELEQAYKKIRQLQSDLAYKQQSYQKQVEELRESLFAYEQKQSSNRSDPVYRELEVIKQILIHQKQETQGVESRYIELINEKNLVENHLKQLQQQLERQSVSLITLNEHAEGLNQQKRELELTLQAKTGEISEIQEHNRRIEQKLQELEQANQLKTTLQDGYEQLKEEMTLLSERLEENCEARLRAEEQLEALQSMTKKQQVQLLDQEKKVTDFEHERKQLQQEVQRLCQQVEETEGRLKIAQQHLAKKVKEMAILNEKLEVQQTDLLEHQELIKSAKTQMNQLHASVDNYQKLEKKLQDQINETLKSTEIQVAKWEEKYFRMYDKWQESDDRIRELKKFEEKYHQMQSLLANLGHFMGSPFASASALLQSAMDQGDKTRSLLNEDDSVEQQLRKSSDAANADYDLFSKRKPPEEKIKPHLFHE